MWTGIEVSIAVASGGLVCLTQIMYAYISYHLEDRNMSTNVARNVIRQILASYRSTKGFDRVGRKVE